MDAYQIRFSSGLQSSLEQKIVELGNLLSTTPAQDHAAYMERVGFIRGIRYALQEAVDLETKLSRPEEKQLSFKTIQRGYET